MSGGPVHRTDGAIASGGPASLASAFVDTLADDAQFQQYESPVVRAVLHRLRDALTSAPPSVITARDHAAAWPGLPLRRLAHSKDAKLEWSPPAALHVGGAFMLRTLPKVGATQEGGGQGGWRCLAHSLCCGVCVRASAVGRRD
jgi:hypothetical protein